MKYRIRRRGTLVTFWIWAGLLAASLAAGVGPAMAGLADTPLPTFADGTPSVAISNVPGVVKRDRLETEFLCTVLDTVPVNVGVEVFDGNGVLQNDVHAGAGVVANAQPGQTVTLATSGTATFLETAVIPLPTGLQGVARVVASSPRVRCTVLVVDDFVTPPLSMLTLDGGRRLERGGHPPSLPLPRFADGRMATHAALFPGVVKRGRAESEVLCTSLAAIPIAVGVEIIGPAGTIGNSVAEGNGALLDVAPGQTVGFGTTGTAALLETQVIRLAGVAQGAARVVSTSPDLLCSAVVLDAGLSPPVSMGEVAAAGNASSTAVVPHPLPAFADGTPSVAVLTVPGVVARGRMETNVLCTVTAGAPVHVGVQVFDAAGSLVNDVGAGVGALLSVPPGHTVTFGTGATQTYLETAVIPANNIAQGFLRVVASAPEVACGVAVIDNAVTPPVAWATLGEGVRAAPGPVPADAPLPRFADGLAATHALVFPGVVKRGRIETDVFCTSLAAVPVDVGVEVFGPHGRVANDVAAGNGAVLGVLPLRTVTIGTTGSASLLETSVITLGSVAQGMARVVTTSPDVICNAVVLDAALSPPQSLAALRGAVLVEAAPTVTPAIPTPTPTPTHATVPCVGDCGGDGTVTVDEIVVGTTIALATASVTECAEFDVNDDNAVTVDELLLAVAAALNGCP